MWFLCDRVKLADAKDALKLLEEEETWQKDAKLDEVRYGIVSFSCFLWVYVATRTRYICI